MFPNTGRENRRQNDPTLQPGDGTSKKKNGTATATPTKAATPDELPAVVRATVAEALTPVGSKCISAHRAHTEQRIVSTLRPIRSIAAKDRITLQKNLDILYRYEQDTPIFQDTVKIAIERMCARTTAILAECDPTDVRVFSFMNHSIRRTTTLVSSALSDTVADAKMLVQCLRLPFDTGNAITNRIETLLHTHYPPTCSRQWLEEMKKIILAGMSDVHDLAEIQELSFLRDYAWLDLNQLAQRVHQAIEAQLKMYRLQQRISALVTGLKTNGPPPQDHKEAATFFVVIQDYLSAIGAQWLQQSTSSGLEEWDHLQDNLDILSQRIVAAPSTQQCIKKNMSRIYVKTKAILDEYGSQDQRALLFLCHSVTRTVALLDSAILTGNGCVQHAQTLLQCLMAHSFGPGSVEIIGCIETVLKKGFPAHCPLQWIQEMNAIVVEGIIALHDLAETLEISSLGTQRPLDANHLIQHIQQEIWVQLTACLVRQRASALVETLRSGLGSTQERTGIASALQKIADTFTCVSTTWLKKICWFPMWLQWVKILQTEVLTRNQQRYPECTAPAFLDALVKKMTPPEGDSAPASLIHFSHAEIIRSTSDPETDRVGDFIAAAQENMITLLTLHADRRPNAVEDCRRIFAEIKDTIYSLLLYEENDEQEIWQRYHLSLQTYVHHSSNKDLLLFLTKYAQALRTQVTAAHRVALPSAHLHTDLARALSLPPLAQMEVEDVQRMWAIKKRAEEIEHGDYVSPARKGKPFLQEMRLSIHQYAKEHRAYMQQQATDAKTVASDLQHVVDTLQYPYPISLSADSIQYVHDRQPFLRETQDWLQQSVTASTLSPKKKGPILHTAERAALSAIQTLVQTMADLSTPSALQEEASAITLVRITEWLPPCIKRYHSIQRQKKSLFAPFEETTQERETLSKIQGLTQYLERLTAFQCCQDSQRFLCEMRLSLTKSALSLDQQMKRYAAHLDHATEHACLIAEIRQVLEKMDCAPNLPGDQAWLHRLWSLAQKITSYHRRQTTAGGESTAQQNLRIHRPYVQNLLTQLQEKISTTR